MNDEAAALDEMDHRILGHLQNDGRISWRELGDRVHLAATSVAERVRRMEQSGVILGYSARVDPRALGRSVRAVIDISLAPGNVADTFEQRLTKRDEVAFVSYVTGSADYTALVECADADDLDAFVRWVRADEAVARTETKFILRTVME